jgi:hypothetical protein
MADRAAFVAGLRELAAFIEAHADVPVPAYPSLLCGVGAGDPVRQFGAAHGFDVDENDEYRTVDCSPRFGPLEYQVYGYDDEAHAHELVHRLQAEGYATKHNLALVPVSDAPADGGAAR